MTSQAYILQIYKKVWLRRPDGCSFYQNEKGNESDDNVIPDNVLLLNFIEDLLSRVSVVSISLPHSIFGSVMLGGKLDPSAVWFLS